MAITKTTNVTTVDVREIDFISSFVNDWSGLINIFGISRAMPKVPGQGIQLITASVPTLEDSPAEGVDIVPSTATVTGTTVTEATILKYATAVTIEMINQYGYETAVARVDEAFKNKLRGVVKDTFYQFLNTGSLTGTAATFQAALAGAKGKVLNKFSTLGLGAGEVVAFVNVEDFYNYLGGASIGAQVSTQFGMNYIRDFLGYRLIFLCDTNEVSSGTVLATPVNNMVAYYVDPSASDFAAAGLPFTTDDVTPIIGYHVEGNYKNMTSEAYALFGLYLFAEHLDGIAKITISSTGA